MDLHKRSGNSLMTDGILSLLIGLILLFLTGASQSVIVFFFAVFAVILGISQIVAARGEREIDQNSGYFTAIGIYSIIAGVFLLFFMRSPLPTVIGLVAIYGLITGVAEVISAYLYRSEVGGYAWLIGGGTVRILFSLFLLFNLSISLPLFVLYLALYAIVEGVIFAIYGYEVRAQIGKYHGRQAA